jgi:hypothetical protein
MDPSKGITVGRLQQESKKKHLQMCSRPPFEVLQDAKKPERRALRLFWRREEKAVI